MHTFLVTVHYSMTKNICLYREQLTTSALSHSGLNRQRQNKKRVTHTKTSPQQESVARPTILGTQ